MLEEWHDIIDCDDATEPALVDMGGGKTTNAAFVEEAGDDAVVAACVCA